MTLDQVLTDAVAAAAAAGGHPEPFKNDKGRTTQIVQALVVYTGLSEIAQNLPDLAAIGAGIDEIIRILEAIRDALAGGQPVDLDPLIEQLELIRTAIYKSA